MESLSLRLLTRDNGVGLSRDIRILADAFAVAGVECQKSASPRDGRSGKLMQAGLWGQRLVRGRVDTQIFIERIYRHCLPLARRNVLVPNPEWLLDKWLPLLPKFDLVLCKTRHAQQVFEAKGCRTSLIGFTSDDRHDPLVARQAAFFHLAGSSAAKGTEALLTAWRHHPEWPLLTVVQSARHARTAAPANNIKHLVGHLDDAHLRQLQNRHLFHICPSEAEGFGHHLVEGMSVGAVVLATDGEPMNEHVTVDRGLLITPGASARQGMGIRYEISPEAIEAAVARALALTEAERGALGAAARAYFLESRRKFYSSIAAVAESLAGFSNDELPSPC